jgi:hypothetical protein
MEAINISNGLKKDESIYRPVPVSSHSVPLATTFRADPTKVDDISQDAFPTPESTPSPPVNEEKKTRWGLGRKMKDKKK